ncbi:MAG: sigma-54-dependent Fis family transcriptional regulator [Oligoflexia bacterium]|nr:sigma-54-dependent Fis family transcriptional regulator [Oligoflexia bacterium]
MSGFENRVLIIDDDERVADAIRGVLEDEGYSVDVVGSGEEALDYYGKNPVDIALLDLWLPGIDGLTAMEKIKTRYPSAYFIAMSGHGNIETAVRATKLGVYDYIEKPVSMEKLLITISNLSALVKLEEENRNLKSSIARQTVMIGNSPPMKALKSQIDTIAETVSSVFITGENGTGKELVARLIHQNSDRKNAPFVDINCAAIPEELIESELFGHEKGSFTGAVSQKRGKFDLASHGTLFLDEIGDMSLKTQAKILRILEEKRFERVGGTEQIKVDVRIIAATNKDLAEQIEKGNFRADLFYRLNVIPIQVPPLRERKEDISELIDHYMNIFCTQYGRPLKQVSEQAMNILLKYNWPGNVRELRNIVERLVIMTKGQLIDRESLPGEILIGSGLTPAGPGICSDIDEIFNIQTIREARDAFETLFIKKKLNDYEGNISKTANAIGMERSSLHRKIRQQKS